MLPNISYQDLNNIVKFAYTGSVNINHDQLQSFIMAATCLQISGVQIETRETRDSDEPQDLSCKPPEKKIKLETCISPSRSTQDSKTRDAVLQKALMSFSPNVTSASVQMTPGVTSTTCHGSRSRQPSTERNCSNGSKLPSWSQTQLQDAIESVITQKLRFTQASAKYGIPKGTLYDNILGKSKRMQVLDEVGLTESQDMSVLEFCCEISSMPYNRRTSKSLTDVIQFVTNMKHNDGDKDFKITMRQGFKWWWAFTKKHNIISLYYQEADNKPAKHSSKTKDPPVQSHENLLNLINSPSSIPINIPTSSFLPFLGLNNHSKYSLQHPDFMITANSNMM